MCGIAGLMRLDGGPVDERLLHRMTDRLVHRGPDDSGTWCSGSVGFGHRRLSIIDLGSSKQPMESADGRYHVTFNGEILNYRSLRAELEYPFMTDGDTEVILASHARDGLGAVSRLRGQFAYAIHDRERGSISLFRDRLGILPVYYLLNSEYFAFASEIKSLLVALPGSPEIDIDSLDDYLSASAVSAPRTLFKGIRKLPAGHWLDITTSGCVVSRYWSIPSADGYRVEGDPVELVGQAIDDAVGESLVADVPVGAYLSGGVDSSLIAAIAAEKAGDTQIETFAAGFGDARFDELPWARHVSKFLGTKHHEITISPSDFAELWHSLTWQRDSPMSQPADFAVYQLARLAKRSVSVVLSGEGSDELFAGYPKFKAAWSVERAAVLPWRLRRATANAISRRLPPGLSRMRAPLRALSERSAVDRHRAWFSPFSSGERLEMLGRTERDSRDGSYVLGNGISVVDSILREDCERWLPDNLLERGDRMSMAASLELRPPFLDHRLVELAFRLPDSVKLRKGTTKWVVKEVARRRLPAEIVDRKKVGFRVPLDEWFRGDLGSMANDMLRSRSSLTASIMDRRAIDRLISRHTSGRTNEDARIWTLLSLEVWADVFLRGEWESSGRSALA